CATLSKRVFASPTEKWRQSSSCPCASALTAKAPLRRMCPAVRLVSASDTSSDGGCTDRESRALAVQPTGPCSLMVVITVTKVGRWAIAARKPSTDAASVEWADAAMGNLLADVRGATERMVTAGGLGLLRCSQIVLAGVLRCARRRGGPHGARRCQP